MSCAELLYARFHPFFPYKKWHLLKSELFTDVSVIECFFGCFVNLLSSYLDAVSCRNKTPHEKLIRWIMWRHGNETAVSNTSLLPRWALCWRTARNSRFWGLSPSTTLTLSPTLLEGESEQKETSWGSGRTTLAPTTTDVTVHTVFVKMYDSWTN